MEKSKNGILLLIVLMYAMITSCQEDKAKESGLQFDKTNEIAEIDSLRILYMEAVKTRDMSAKDRAVSGEAITMYPDSEEWRKMKQLSKKSPSYDSLLIHPLEIEVINNEWAFELGYSDAWYTPEGSDSTIQIHDTYLVIFRNIGEGWQLYREVSSGRYPSKDWIKKADKLGRE